VTSFQARAALETLVRKGLLRLIRLSRYPKRTILATADFFLLGFALWLSMSLRLGEPYVPPSAELFLIFCAAPAIGVATFFQLGLYRLVAALPPSELSALVLDALTTRLSKFARLSIFIPYAIPAVIGTLMWGFLYSPIFGPLKDLFATFNQSAPAILSAQNIFGGLLNIVYSGGTIELYRDPSKDHDYGITPPNATAPSTFTNGTLLLGGTLSSFFMYYDPSTGTGAYEATAQFTSGTGLAALNQLNADAYTFGGTLGNGAAGGNVPQGYDLQVDGVIEVTVPVGVQRQSWSGIKEMYRR